MSIAAKKVLVPLTVLLAAGALAVGSGATFSSESNNTISTVTSGTLLQSNSKNGAQIFGLSGIKPGDTVNGTVTITNTGSLPAVFSLTEVASSNGFSGANLKLKIENTTTNTTVFNDTFGALVDGAKTDLGTVAPAAANTYVFTVTLDQNATDTEQGKTASATYKWSSVQEAGTVTNQ
jgi:spore coat-associated protein N